MANERIMVVEDEWVIADDIRKSLKNLGYAVSSEAATGEEAIQKAEEEKDKLIQKLREALSKVKKLSGLIPIYASCKKKRDGKGNWEHIETYIHDHSKADFTHGICPDCYKELYPDLCENEK